MMILYKYSTPTNLRRCYRRDTENATHCPGRRSIPAATAKSRTSPTTCPSLQARPSHQGQGHRQYPPGGLCWRRESDRHCAVTYKKQDKIIDNNLSSFYKVCSVEVWRYKLGGVIFF